MTPRTLDVPELSSIEPTETLADYHRRVRPVKPSLRTIAACYLPTVGLLSIVQGIRYYVRHPKG